MSRSVHGGVGVVYTVGAVRFVTREAVGHGGGGDEGAGLVRFGVGVADGGVGVPQHHPGPQRVRTLVRALLQNHNNFVLFRELPGISNNMQTGTRQNKQEPTDHQRQFDQTEKCTCVMDPSRVCACSDSGAVCVCACVCSWARGCVRRCV